MADSTSRQDANRTRPVSKEDGPPGGGQNNGPKTGLGIDVQQAHALLIGVGRCRHDAWSLTVTTRDVRQLAKVLADPDLAAYPRQNIRLLTDEAATREGILVALAELAEVAAGQSNATCFIYFSGHGWQDTAGNSAQYFLIPHDVDPNRITATALLAEDFMAALREIRSRRFLVMLDTCHASSFADAKEVVIPSGFEVQPLPAAIIGTGEGRAVFLSCRQEQKSWIRPGENSLSVFTHHLIAGLNEAGWARGEEGNRTVTIGDLMSYLAATVPAGAAQLGEEQTPFFKFETENFAVALDRGGKGGPKSEPPVLPAATAPGTLYLNIPENNPGRDANSFGRVETLTINNS